MKKHPLKSKTAIVFLTICICLCMIIGSIILINNGQRKRYSLSPSQEVLRGDRVLVLRFGNPDNHESIDIFEDKTIVYTMITENNISYQNKLLLSKKNWDEITTLSSHWCTDSANLSPPNSNEIFYEVAVHCPGTFRAVSFKIPPNQLPLVLVDVVNAGRATR